MKVETDIIVNISASPIGRARIFVISVEAFRTDIIIFIGYVIMCFTSDWGLGHKPPDKSPPTIKSIS